MVLFFLSAHKELILLITTTIGFLIGWLAEAAWLVFASGHGLGAVFNQLVRSRAQLLGAVVCSK